MYFVQWKYVSTKITVRDGKFVSCLMHTHEQTLIDVEFRKFLLSSGCNTSKSPCLIGLSFSFFSTFKKMQFHHFQVINSIRHETYSIRHRAGLRMASCKAEQKTNRYSLILQKIKDLKLKHTQSTSNNHSFMSCNLVYFGPSEILRLFKAPFHPPKDYETWYVLTPSISNI